MGFITLASTISHAGEVLHLYGPGGPYPAMRDAAELFGKRHNVELEVVAGPTAKWLDKAKADADMIYSGAEFMMTDFIRAMEGRIDEATVTPPTCAPRPSWYGPATPRTSVTSRIC